MEFIIELLIFIGGCTIAWWIFYITFYLPYTYEERIKDLEMKVISLELSKPIKWQKENEDNKR